jgi:hypothetical protein
MLEKLVVLTYDIAPEVTLVTSPTTHHFMLIDTRLVKLPAMGRLLPCRQYFA